LLAAEKEAMRLTGTAMAMGFLAALLAALVQGGLVFSPSVLQPNLERFNPVEHVRQMFSITAAGRLLKSLVPGSAIAWLAWSMLVRDWRSFPAGLYLRPAGTIGFVFARVFEIAWKAALVLLAWSAADYLIERQRLSGDLRMSRQEVRDEYKETEGNPAIKGRIRRLRRHVHRRQMLEAVKRAAVVVTNPDEFAVALEYVPLMNAPVVVAKGRNLFARQIKDLARWHGVALVENRPLAHALYRAVDVGQSIPPKLYTVVAAVLAAVYRAQERAHQHAARQTPGTSARSGG
jgi:flagellar biosynthetic protein FlhB